MSKDSNLALLPSTNLSAPARASVLATRSAVLTTTPEQPNLIVLQENKISLKIGGLGWERSNFHGLTVRCITLMLQVHIVWWVEWGSNPRPTD